MANLNKVFLIGNLTRDPELRYTPSGTAVTDIRIAINRRWRGQDGQQRDETCFVDVTVWARQAETVTEYCRKGRAVFVEGRLQLDTWEDQQTGQRRSRLRVVADRVQFLGGRGQGPTDRGDPDTGQGPPRPRGGDLADTSRPSKPPPSASPDAYPPRAPRDAAPPGGRTESIDRAAPDQPGPRNTGEDDVPF